MAEVPYALAATTGALCVSVYVDANLNGRHDPDESPLAGTQITLAGAERDTLDYDGADDPLCRDLAPGQYTIGAVLPGGYGLTSTGNLLVQVTSGRRIEVAFGGAEGFTLPPTPTTGAEDLTAEKIDPGAVAPVIATRSGEAEEKSALERLYNRSGLIVLGAAGVIAVASAVMLLAFRRP